jgi:hypothetical protein
MALAVRGLRLAIRSFWHPNCHTNCAISRSRSQFQIVGRSRDRKAKGTLSERYEFRRVDNSIWRQLQDVLRTIQEVRGYADASARKFRP